nr:retrovirus-related Pol polyprotein from transposon TNT 1-94 [Tanacetum cinerariifolium]
MLIFSRTSFFLWAEAIATACFTQNRSIIHRRFNKTPYELINGRKLDISFLHVFGALCFPKNDREDIGKLDAKDIAPIPTNLSSHATNTPITSQDVDELNPNAMVDDNTFSKYVLEILNKYGMESCDPVGTPVEIKDKLDLDQNGTPVDATKYRSMIGLL